MATKQALGIREEQAMNRLVAAAQRVATDRGVTSVNLNPQNKNSELQAIERLEAMATFLESIASPASAGAGVPAEPGRNWGAEDEPDGEVGDKTPVQTGQPPAATPQTQQVQRDPAVAARAAQAAANAPTPTDTGRPTGAQQTGGKSVTEQRDSLRPSGHKSKDN